MIRDLGENFSCNWGKLEYLSENSWQIIVNVKVAPGAKIEKHCQEGDHVKVFLRARPVEGAANKALQEYFSKALGIPKSAISILKGDKGREKQLALYFETKKNKGIEFFKDKILKFGIFSFLFFFCFFATPLARAQDEVSKDATPAADQQETSQLTERDVLLNEYEAVLKVKQDEFPQQFFELNKKAQDFLEREKNVCSNQYDAITFEQSGVEKAEAEKLSRDEKESCFRKLRSHQVVLIESQFNARKNYLKKLHEKVLQDLDKAKNDAIQEAYQNFEQNKKMLLLQQKKSSKRNRSKK